MPLAGCSTYQQVYEEFKPYLNDKSNSSSRATYEEQIKNIEGKTAEIWGDVPEENNVSDYDKEAVATLIGKQLRDAYGNNADIMDSNSLHYHKEEKTITVWGYYRGIKDEPVPFKAEFDASSSVPSLISSSINVEEIQKELTELRSNPDENKEEEDKFTKSDAHCDDNCEVPIPNEEEKPEENAENEDENKEETEKEVSSDISPDRTYSVSVSSGISITAHHSGEGTLSIWLTDKDGQIVATVFNDDGTFDETRNADLEQGEYQVNMANSGGSWSFQYESY